ncbi:MAG: hypothetical protein ABMA01_17445, partial [Chthoniobacteraceae bacterium]
QNNLPTEATPPRRAAAKGKDFSAMARTAELGLTTNVRRRDESLDELTHELDRLAEVRLP